MNIVFTGSPPFPILPPLSPTRASHHCLPAKPLVLRSGCLSWRFQLCSFPGPAVISYHKPDGFKEQRCIISQFWRLKVRNRDVSRAMLPLKAPGQDPYLFLSWLLGATDIPWHSLACGHIAPVSTSVFSVCPLLLERHLSLNSASPPPPRSGMVSWHVMLANDNHKDPISK